MDGFVHSGNNVPYEYHGYPVPDACTIGRWSSGFKIGSTNLEVEISKFLTNHEMGNFSMEILKHDIILRFKLMPFNFYPTKSKFGIPNPELVYQIHI